MKTKLIVMLTHNDKTASNSLALFEDTKDLPVDLWGFKEVGLPVPQMKALLHAMKTAGKTTFLEVLSQTEEDCMKHAKFAVELGFDYITGTIFHESVWAYLKQNNIKYFPFVGKHFDDGSMDGDIDEMIAEGKRFAEKGVQGISLCPFRYKGEQTTLGDEFLQATAIPVIVAGSINNRERMAYVDSIGTWAFTVGSALFNGTFVKDGSFRENLIALIDLMDSIN
ncbi:MAG: hypothetical protein LBN36_09155 [Clostridiales Family XIII bacterium]|jgi:hypothetical protein|nr:hypothetical protein [Clostridiales Family XIII bacterium]